MKRFTQCVTSLLFSCLILYALLWRFDLWKVLESVRQARPSYLLLGTVLLVVAYLFRGVRWQIWERSLSYWDSFRLILIGFMGNNLLPARLGEILRAHCAASKTSDDRGRTTALASISAERILDGLVLSLFGLIGVALVPVDHRLHWGLFAISLAFAGLTIGLIFGIHFHEQIR